jgi:hypothetical protein
MNKKDRKFNYQRLQDAKAVYLTHAGWNEEANGHWSIKGSGADFWLLTFNTAFDWQSNIDRAELDIDKEN